MKNTKKRILTLSAVALCLAVSGGAASSIKASAAEVNNTVNTVNFQMASGAAIRIDANTQDDKNENGIRYQITMPDSEYKALETNSAYDSVSYGILIAPSDYVTKYGALDKANVFGNEAVYDWAVKNESGNWVYEGDGSKTRIMNFESDTLSPWSKDETVRTYFGSIVNLDETNLPRDFVGVGYIKYTVGDVTDYVFAQANDNVRSMSQVARLAYADTSENALEQTTKDELKKTYIDDVFGNSFEFDSAKDAYLSVNNKNTTIVTDGNVKGLKATIVQPSGNSGLTPAGRQDLRINVGGEYQFKEIEKIVIRYKVTASNNDGWWRLFFNDNTTDGQQISKTTGGVSFTTETGRQSEVMTTYCTLTIEPAIANSATGLTGDDYFYAINIGYRDQADREMTMIIDSVVVYTGYKAEYLNFDETASLWLVQEGYNTSLVDLGNGNKALQADLSQWYNGGTRYNLKINLGGKYKVSEIASVEISYKVSAVTTTSTGFYWNIHLNASGSYTSVDYNNRLTGIGSTVFQTTSGFNKITLTDAGAAGSSLTGNTVGGTLLNKDSYLENLFFCVNGSGTANIATIQIDYIKITLK